MAIQDISNLAIEDSFQGLVQIDTASGELGTALGATISSVAVTASFATTASYAINSAPQVSASFATSASVADRASQAASATTAGFANSATTALSASFSEGARNATSASFATDARQADTSITASHALTSVLANSATSASFAEDARIADSALTATSASYALVAASVQGTIDSASVAVIANSLSPNATASYADVAGSARNADSASVAARATTLSADATASYADLAGNARNADSASNALRAVSASIADSIKNGINASFNNITATSASFTNVTSVTSSVVITGDAFIQLNNNTPTQRYAGINVVDSGSANLTSSFQYDGQTDDWFLEKDILGITEFGVALFGPTYAVKGVPTYNVANTILKSNGNHHVLDSSITDNGSLVTINNPLNVTGTITGSLFGNASTATSASHAVNADTATSSSFASTAAIAVSASFAENASTATSASYALTAGSSVSSSFAENARTADSATTASHALSIPGVISNDVTFNGSVNGTVNALAIVSTTASIDMSSGNFFTLTMPAGGAVHLTPINIQAGQTVNIQSTQNATPSTLDFNDAFKFESGSTFIASTGSGALDLLSFVSFNTSNVLGTGINNLV